MTRKVLVVDDSSLVCEHVAAILGLDGLEVESETDGLAALERLRSGSFHLVITDWQVPGLNGMALLHEVRAESLPLGVIVLTGFGDPRVAIEAMKNGADDFITKPFEPVRFRYLVRRVLERRELEDELTHLRRQMRDVYGFQNIVSRSPRMRRVFDLIEQVAPLSSTVLLHGETGTGKDLVASAIHATSARPRGPWVPVNCAALHESLLESELFGHERGAFTGADRQRKGRFELAHGGTLFLDEVGDVSPAVQAKLLRVLQTGQFERVGGTETLEVDVRIIAASNKRLDEEVKEGRFRSDLFFRLNVFRIGLPPLRERPEDIPLLAAHFLQRFRTRSTPPVTEIHHEAMQALLDHSWPGNVRELENSIKAAVAMADGPIIHREDLPAVLSGRPPRRPGAGCLTDIERPLPEVTDELIKQVERDYLAQLLTLYKGNVARCAKHSGLSRRSVTQKLQKYGLDRLAFKLAPRISTYEEGHAN
jgi:DNA-binding NtrC family response regulator